LPGENYLLPLYGIGFASLGRNAQLIEEAIPAYGPDELLVRHDTTGLCYTDIKIINEGPQRYRVSRDMQQEPVVLGHEVALTVASVGDNLRQHYRVGDRFIVQPAVYIRGVLCPYGVAMRGGLCQYGVVDQRVLNSDDGNQLIPVRPHTGYAESALIEPWACVLTTYQLQYRTHLKPGGATWLIGAPGARDDYYLSAGFDEKSHPASLALTQVPARFAARLREQANRLQLGLVEISPGILYDAPAELPRFDDIIILGPAPDLIEAASRYLARDGIVAIIADAPLVRPVQVDVGRLHYDGWTYVGTPGPDIAQAYRPIRAELKPGGNCWFVGAGGPMGYMHTQYALSLPRPPARLLCTARTSTRLHMLEQLFAADARARDIRLDCLSLDSETYLQRLTDVAGTGFDDIIVMALSPTAIAEAAAYLAPGGVMNIFAGLVRGTLVPLDLSAVYQKNVRFIGHLGATAENMRQTLTQAEAGRLSPNRSVQAVGSLAAARAALQAVSEGRFLGKVVIFPQIKDFALTPLTDLKQKLPTVYAKLKDGQEWTAEAEQEFLELMLPEASDPFLGT
jgi:threonine dehydrogenase-like Zn-dependent dehydrogenase